MEKMEYDPGLISYTTEKRLEGKRSHILRPKAAAYALILVTAIGAFLSSIITRIPVELDVIRDRGALYQLNGMGQIENSYTVKIMNMDTQDQRFKLHVYGLEGIRLMTTSEASVASGEVFNLPTTVEVNPENLTTSSNTIVFEVISVDNSKLRAETESRFLGSPE
jgi:polyferredoxin